MTIVVHVPRGDTIAKVALISSLIGLIFGRFQTVDIENYIQIVISIYLMVSIYLEKRANHIYETW